MDGPALAHAWAEGDPVLAAYRDNREKGTQVRPNAKEMKVRES
jgi:hypothetical protein